MRGLRRDQVLPVIFILFACYAFSMLDRQILAIISTPLKQDLAIGDFMLGLLLGPAFAISYILFGPLFGLLSDRWSRPKSICLGLLVWTAGTFACGLAGSFAALLVFRLLVGAGEAALSPSAYAIIADIVPQHRLSISITVYNWGATLGLASSMVFGGWALDAATRMGLLDLPFLSGLAPWQLVFVAVALPGLLLARIALRLPDTGSRRKEMAAAVPVSEFRAWLKSRRRFLTCHFLAFGLSNMVAYSALVWTPQFMERTFGYSASRIGLTFGILVFVAPLVGGFVSSVLADRLFKQGVSGAHMHVYFWLLLLTTPLVCVAYVTSNEWVFWCGVMAILVIMMPIIGVASAALQLVTPVEFRGRVSGAFVSFVNLTGAVAGPVIVGGAVEFLFRDESRLGWGMAALSAVATVMTLPLLWRAGVHMSEAIAADAAGAGDVSGVAAPAAPP